jgi:hypothetical protein
MALSPSIDNYSKSKNLHQSFYLRVKSPGGTVNIPQLYRIEAKAQLRLAVLRSRASIAAGK